MHLDKLTISNFKSFGDEPQTIEFSAISLLFGKNGSGKSSVLQALGYLYEVFVNAELNPKNLTLCGSKYVGGFKNLVHKKDTSRKMLFKLEFYGLSSMWHIINNQEANSLVHDLFMMGIYPGPITVDSGEPIGHCSVEFSVQYNAESDKVEASNAIVEINKERLFEVILNKLNKRTKSEYHIDAIIRNFNYNHSLFKVNEFVYDEELYMFLIAGGESQSITGRLKKNKKLGSTIEYLVRKYDGIPIQLGSGGESKYFFNNVSERAEEFIADIEALYPTSVNSNSLGIDHEARAFEEIIRIYYSFAFKTARRALENFVHIGPMRIIPDAYFKPSYPIVKSAWYSGEAGWSCLFDSNEAKHKTNELIEKIIKLDYKVDINRGNIDLLELKHGNVTISPSDTGLGVSQIFPVVIARAMNYSTIIEQPELHLHPSVQLNVADMAIYSTINSMSHEENKASNVIDEIISHKNELSLFFLHQISCLEDEDIDKAISSSKVSSQMIVETHSEHIILRLLKRIRESDKHVYFHERVLEPQFISVNVIHKDTEQTKVSRLSITHDGDFDVDWPGGFFDERDEELF